MEGFLILIVLSGVVSILQGQSRSLSTHQILDMCHLTAGWPVFEYEYYQRGDIIIGGLFSVYTSTEKLKLSNGVYDSSYVCSGLDIIEYEFLMAFFFAIDEINKNPDLLPNITLGYHLFDTCGYNIKAIDSVLRILSGFRNNAPNYSCMEGPEVAGFVGDTLFLPTLAVAELLNVYQYPQISHRVTDPLLSDRQKFPYFYRTVQSSQVWYEMVVKFLRIFGWNWVGIITSSDGTGETELQVLRKEMTRHGICIEFVIYLTNDVHINRQRMIKKSTTDVVVVPQAQCNKPCPPGYRKSPTEGIHACCYLCVPCSVGAFSNVTDSDICHECPDDQQPDERRVICIPKSYEYLSYDTNIIAPALFNISLLCSVVTLFILTLFVLLRDTPVVKANNRTVSFILLTSILLSFLSVFLFLGRPVDITCMLRQISFGIFFSIAVSSVLAKTITVCIAFKASKPGSYWRKWVGEKISNSVVIICSSVQVLICVIWLSVSPPYQEYDMHSYPGKIIIQCNEGSVVGFYSMLGYLGLLAAVSFVLAFMVRTLPDSFNEAKYITFSMLVFCSVWIAMIPAYLSTRGKYMVAVEVFAILASSAGLLSFIFFPKCYIIIIKPERNSIKYIMDKVKS
ncbi:vomeronasal type-2 receptor 26-like [Pyxicephalus adspersus]|uniref:vomeronasal type-2 receptor 26-like n=1 Tax=Pyxicephalus adspersus TaxID=30357 RepID=UPI003B5AEEB9